jgi:hypothetical protein
MKTLMTLFTGMTLIGCAGADHQSTRVALASSAVFHAENEANGSKAATGISLSLFEVARVLVRLDHVARLIVNANHSMM